MLISNLAAHLKTHAGVSALTGTKVYINVVSADAALPYLTIQRLPGRDHQRHQLAVSGLVQTLLQINCYASTPTGAETLFEAIRDALDHLLRTTLGAGLYTETITSVVLEDDFGDVDYLEDGSGTAIHGVKSTWLIWHAESLPGH